MLHSVWLLGTFATRSASRVFGRNSMTNASFSMGNVCVKQGAIVEPSSRFDAIVGKADDLADGMMKEVQVQTEPALSVILVKNKGNITAVGNKCTHYGAPLIKGSFSADTGVIRCPWHGACFNAQTGDIEDFPGLDSLPRYDVSVEDDGSVRVRGTFVKGQHKRAKTCARVDEEGQTVVIIGGGGAAQTCAETLRTRTRSPWTGKIIMLSKEISAPYDRPKLSKAMTSSGKDLKLRPEYFHQGANIDLRTGGKTTKNIEYDFICSCLHCSS
jgi:nitrite reductase/ring-hydroxylating ferredoxin subunit